jgi:predicted CXXCH cytochrome family protein
MLWLGCDAASRHRVLTVFFDGVPPPGAAVAPAPGQGRAAGGERPRKTVYGAHGPYAARLCNACHESAATNALVARGSDLCFRCHELALDKKYIHGPLASGGCIACHDPHGSQYRYLLVSESDSFCFRCHERQTVASIAIHGGIEEGCTSCHDPHMSDQPHLLK